MATNKGWRSISVEANVEMGLVLWQRRKEERQGIDVRSKENDE